jgi:hypothetical protein
MDSPGDFVNGANIRFRALFTSIFGASLLAYFTGLADFILSLADIPIAALQIFTRFLGAAVGVLAGLPAVIIRDGFAAAIPFVVGSGPAGIFVALGISLTTLYIVERGVSYVRE